MISIDAAIEIAQRGLASLSPDPERESYPLRPLAPLLVKRIDVPGTYYYLVGWESDKGVEAIVAVDVTASAMIAAVTIPLPVSGIGITADQAQASAPSHSNKTVTAVPELVWFPCHESASLFQPFYQVTTEKGPIFVRLDGQVFAKLTPFGKGG